MATAVKKIQRGRPAGTKSADPTVAKAFGQAVVALRSSKGLSQEAVGLNAAIGRSNMSAIENGRTVPNLVGVVKIAAALGCSLPVLAREFEQIYKKLLHTENAETRK